MNSSVVSVVVALGAINWFVLESRWAKSKVKDGFKVYGVPRGLKILFFIAIPMFVYGAIVNAVENPSERWVSAMLLTFAILGAVFFPATILLSRDKAVSVRWFGLKRVEMKWSEVVAVYLNPEQRSVVIQDKNQDHIVHTILNVDRDGFVSELRALPTAVANRITFQL